MFNDVQNIDVINSLEKVLHNYSLYNIMFLVNFI